MLILQATDDVAARAAMADAGAIDRTLALAWRLLEAAESFALALSELGDINLPPVVGSGQDRANLQAIAPLYLAAELEAARLITAVETLAGLFVSGGLQRDLGPASKPLLDFWRGRHQRLAAEEREALYAQLFGTNFGATFAAAKARNTDFESLMIDLAEALYKLEDVSDAGLEVPVQTAANQLADNLVTHGGGMALVASRHLLSAIETCVAILKRPQVQQAVGAHSLWQAVQNISQSYLGVQVDTASHVTRGKAGLQILTWLAEVVPFLEQTGHQLVPPGSPVMAAAGSRLEASLTLHEQEDAPTAPRS
jgi:hypothetical protein